MNAMNCMTFGGVGFRWGRLVRIVSGGGGALAKILETTCDKKIHSL